MGRGLASHHGGLTLGKLRWAYFILPNLGRPPESHTSYRPICLINIEAKILAKALANRLLLYITQAIQVDQAGFMPQRATRHNIRRANIAIHTFNTLDVPGALLLADMDRAFDSLSWTYLFTLIDRLNLGPRFVSYLRLLYTDITSTVCDAGHVSSSFPIGRGTRQGCPLSPYIFALAMEPLAAWVRWDPILEGFEWSRDLPDHIALYADDVLFFLTNINRSGPRLLNIMIIFGETTGLFMNPTKSTLWLLGPNLPYRGLGFNPTDYDGGLQIPRGLPFKYTQNRLGTKHPSVWARVRDELKRWSHMPLSLPGRSAIFKMVFLPSLLYQLQNYPYRIAPSWFRQVNSALGQVLWSGKSARVALRTCFVSTYLWWSRHVRRTILLYGVPLDDFKWMVVRE